MSARWGGEEFICFFHNTNIQEAYVLAEKIKEVHGLYFSEPRFEKTLCNADNIEDVKNIAQCFYPQMEANKIVYNRPIDDPEFKEIDEYSKTKAEIVDGWSFKDQSGLKSKLESTASILALISKYIW